MNEDKIVLTDRECKLLEMIREIEHGELRVVIQDKTPIRVEELKRSIKL